MTDKKVISSEDSLVVREATETYTATLGNVQDFFNERTEKHYKQVLLRDIKNQTGEVKVGKQWFMSGKLCGLARKNLNKKVSFTASCTTVLLKQNGKLTQEFIFLGVKEIELS